MKPVEYSVPLRGFVAFASKKSINHFFNGKSRKYRVTCEDVFGGKHVIAASLDQFVNLKLFRDWAEI